tara:strand:- start:434 stop:1096 length:663 start_codon:yes stop_codon:yes gene_type:complete
MKKSKELAYWIGVAQSDGCFRNYFEKRGNKLIERYKLQLGVREKSLPMLEKFRGISQELFGTTGNTSINRKRTTVFEIKIKRFLKDFKELDIDFYDPPNPPNWCEDNYKYFCAYLAGIIDGDGDIRISRIEYPMCAVRITSSKEQKKLRKSIIKNLSCGCSQRNLSRESIIEGRKVHGKYSVIEFYISPKNFKIIQEFLVKELSLEYKRNKLIEYIKTRN